MVHHLCIILDVLDWARGPYIGCILNLLLDIDLITLVSFLSPLPSSIVGDFRVFPIHWWGCCWFSKVIMLCDMAISALISSAHWVTDKKQTKKVAGDWTSSHLVL